jgi:UDP-glucose 4-epimerase
MRTLVTGGAGFVGSNLVDRMVRQGHEVVVVDNLSSGYSENLVGNCSGPCRRAATGLTVGRLLV